MTQSPKLGNIAHGTAVPRDPDLVRRDATWVYIRTCNYKRCNNEFGTHAPQKVYCSRDCWYQEYKRKNKVARQPTQPVSISVPAKIRELLPQKNVSAFIEYLILNNDLTDYGDCETISASLGPEARAKLRQLGKNHRSRAIQVLLVNEFQKEGLL